MKREIIHITSKPQWLSERMKDITSTDIPVLFGLSPYKTLFQLWLEKSTCAQDTIDENESMQWGAALEDAIARKISRDHNLQANKIDYYERITDIKIGSSYDYCIVAEGMPILEIKNVSEHAFRKLWTRTGDKTYEAPAHIEMQVQHQLLVSGKKEAFIAALVGGNRSILIEREADQRIHEIIIKHVNRFWDSIKNNDAPNPDYERDAQTIIELNKNGLKDETYDASQDSELSHAIQTYSMLKNDINEKEKQLNKLKALIIHKTHNYKRIECGNLSVCLSDVCESQGTLITPEMIGERYGKRKGYRSFKVIEKVYDND
jgi:putative phage-type endonuclease